MGGPQNNEDGQTAVAVMQTIGALKGKKPFVIVHTKALLPDQIEQRVKRYVPEAVVVAKNLQIDSFIKPLQEHFDAAALTAEEVSEEIVLQWNMQLATRHDDPIIRVYFDGQAAIYLVRRSYLVKDVFQNYIREHQIKNTVFQVSASGDVINISATNLTMLDLVAQRAEYPREDVKRLLEAMRKAIYRGGSVVVPGYAPRPMEPLLWLQDKAWAYEGSFDRVMDVFLDYVHAGELTWKARKIEEVAHIYLTTRQRLLREEERRAEFDKILKVRAMFPGWLDKVLDVTKDDSAKVGGIDIQNINVARTGPSTGSGQGIGEAIKFDEAALQGIVNKGFDGLTPVFLGITPMDSPLKALGIK
jgi:hypothetical protein